MSSTGSADPSSSPLIAYVDDNAAVRYALSRVLRGAGFNVSEGERGEDALRLADAGADLVILDVQLPDLSGFEVCRRIKQNANTSFVPVLHLTATYVGIEDKVAALESGADGYLTHPVEPVVLLATVRALLRARAAEKQVRATARQWQQTFDAMQEGVEILDPQGRILRCNQTMAEWRGARSEGLVGAMGVPFFTGAAEPPEGWPVARAVRSLKRATSLVQKGDRWFRVSADPVLDGRGGCESVVRIVVDITDQKRLEAERDAILERSVAVLSSITEAYFALDRNWRFVEVNPVGPTASSGSPRQACWGRCCGTSFPPPWARTSTARPGRPWTRGRPCTSRPIPRAWARGSRCTSTRAASGSRCTCGTSPSASRRRPRRRRPLPASGRSARRRRPPTA
jgi:PAS domain S-box-containing protein